MFTVLVCCLLLVAAACGDKLQRYNIDVGSIAVVGISSGGYMTTQLHVAHSKTFKYAGNVAGGPYWCANANVLIAETSCMATPSLIVVEELVAATSFAFAVLSIDAPSNMVNSKVYLFSGTKDTVVNPGVLDKTVEYYSHYVPSSAIKLVNNIQAEHAWVTDSWGNDCDNLGSPYINNCTFDMSGDMLTYFYGSLKPKVAQVSSNMLSFYQGHYTPLLELPLLLSLDDTGYVYVPSACANGTLCKLVVALHGCEQGSVFVGNSFITHNGINEWAESNNIIVLYPQAISITSNPKGCWDWWGYTNMDYATRLGPQIKTIFQMVSALAGNL